MSQPRAVLAGDQRALEMKVLLLQSSIAGFFVAGALLGWFGGNRAELGAVWVGSYHIVHAVYVLKWRIPGRPSLLVEFATPLLDVSCITTAWIVLGDVQSPFWAVYLYALVGYGRRFIGARYAVLAGYIVVNLVFARTIIATDTPGTALFNASLLTMVVLVLAVASLSHAIGTAWRKAEHRARALSELDPLTGIANRRVFLERLEALAGDASARFAVLMLDLDDFKRLNDAHGHLYGDRVLEQVAHILRDRSQGMGEVARYGGEEFVVMLPGASLEFAARTAEALRRDIMVTTPTTVSVGCAARYPGESAEATLRRADDLLLAAKHSTKNTVRTSDLRLTA